MPQSIEKTTAPEGFEVVSTQDGSVTVQLPNKWKVSVADTQSNEQAIAAASKWYENKKESGDKDELLFTDLLVQDKQFLKILREDYTEIDSANQNEDWYKDPDLLIKKYARDQRFRDGNLFYAGKAASQSFGKNLKQKQRRAYLLNVWQSMPDFHDTGGSGFSGLMENIEAGITDPLTIVSFLAAPFTMGGSLVAATAAKQAVGAGVRTATKEVIRRGATSQVARSTAIYGGIDGAASAGFSYLNQLERVNVDMQDEIDYGRVAVDGAIGAALSTGISAVSTAAVRTKPVRKLVESQKIKNFARKNFFVNHASDWLTTYGKLGREGAFEARTGQGELDAFQFEILTLQERLKSTILEAHGVDTKKVSWEQWLEQDPNNRLVLHDYVAAYNKDTPQVNKEDGGLVDLDARTGETPAYIATTGELDEQLLIKNPKVREAVKDLVDLQVSERLGVESLAIGKSPFESTQTLHSTRRYEAFENGDANLARLKETPEGRAKYSNAVRFVQDQARKLNNYVHPEQAEEAVNFIAMGKLEQALKTLKDNPSVLASLSDEDLLAKGIHGKTLDDLDNAAAVSKGTKVSRKNILTPVVKERVDMPPEIREILGEIDDPITGALEATYRLGIVRRKIQNDQLLLESFINTGQIDRLGVDTTLLDTPIAEINKDVLLKSGINPDIVPRAKDFVGPVMGKTLRQAVKDGDVSGVEQFKIIVENNRQMKDAAFEQVSKEGQIYNPLALTHFSNDFDDAYNQAAFGASLKEREGMVGSAIQFGYKANYAASASKTVYSLKTQSLNQIGGFSSYIMMNGPQISWRMPFQKGSDMDYLRKSYMPMLTEVVRGHVSKENKGKLYSRLVKKGYSEEEVNDVVQDFRELLKARIIDSDFLTDFERTITAEGRLAKFGKGLYDKTGVIKVGNEFTKRAYAASDEMYKVLMYKNQKQKFVRAGFTSSEAARIASQDVLDFMPNYRYLPKIFKAGRAVGVGAFLAHTAEITRNVFNLYRRSGERILYAQKLINAGEKEKGRALRRDAMMRLGRASAIIGTVGYFAEEINSVLGGEEQSPAARTALEVFAPEWGKGDAPVITSVDGDGNVTLFHPNRVFPVGPLLGAFQQFPLLIQNEMAKGSSLDTAATTAGAQTFMKVASPFLSASPGTGPIIQFLQDDQLSLSDRFSNLVKNFGKSFTPGAILDIRKGYDIMARDKKGGLEDEYNIGPNGKPKDLSMLLREQLGSRESVLNVGFSTTAAYAETKRKMNRAQSKFASYFNFAKFSEGVEQTGDVLLDLSQNADGVRPEYFLNEEKFVEVIDAFVDANNERFLEQRQLLFLFTAHANYLREQTNYQGKNGNVKIFEEVYKRAKYAGVPKKYAEPLVRGAVYPSSMPRFVPYMISQANMDKSVDALVRQNMPRDQAYLVVNKLFRTMEEAVYPMYNQRLNTRIKDE